MRYRSIEVETNAGVSRIWMNRPEVHNAFDEAMIAELTDAYARLEADDTVRVVVLGGRGRSFSAGADFDWMRRAAGQTLEDNLRDARAMAEMLRRIDRCPKPTIARVHGAARGGGVGLASVCDIAIAAQPAVFATPEVLYGLIPSTISPYVIAAIGPREARRYFLTGERFDADEARRIGLVHTVCAIGDLDTCVDALIGALLAGGPKAQAAAKALIRRVTGPSTDRDELIEYSAQSIAQLRVTDEGREGIAAFLQKRKPGWRQ